MRVAIGGFRLWLLPLCMVACTGSVTINVGRGDVEVRLPEGYQHTKSYPLVLLLPSYGMSATAFYEQVQNKAVILVKETLTRKYFENVDTVWSTR